MTLICCVTWAVITMATGWGVVARGGHTKKTALEGQKV